MMTCKIRLLCKVCDYPIADDQDYHEPSIPDSTLCWVNYTRCHHEPVDWRQRTILAEAKLRVIEKTLKLTN